MADGTRDELIRPWPLWIYGQRLRSGQKVGVCAWPGISAGIIIRQSGTMTGPNGRITPCPGFGTDISQRGRSDCKYGDRHWWTLDYL